MSQYHEGSWLYKFDGHSHGDSGDIMFLVVEKEDSLKLSQFCH